MAHIKHPARFVAFVLFFLSLLIGQNAMAQDRTWQPVGNNVVKQQPASKRITGEIIGGLVGAAPALAIGAIFGRFASDRQMHKNYQDENQFSNFQRTFLIAALLTPMTEALAVHMVGDHSGSMGKGWTPYAGAAVGGVVGGGLGVLGFLDDDKTGMLTIWGGAAAGALIGALLWYELSNLSESNKAISNVRPVVSVSDQYSSIGVGFDF